MNTLRSVLISVVINLALVSCSNPFISSIEEENTFAENSRVTAKNLAPDSSSIALVAGQNLSVGSIDIAIAQDDLVLSLVMEDGWLLSEIHIDLGQTLVDIPQTKKGNPIPGQFAYSYEISTDADVYACTIPLDDAMFSEEMLYFAVHGIVTKDGQSESAWAINAAGGDFPGKNWATYFICEVPSIDEDIEIAGSWINESMGNLLVVIDNTTFEYPELGMQGRIVSFDNNTNTAIMEFPDVTYSIARVESMNYIDSVNYIYNKSMWTEPTEGGFTSCASDFYDTVEEAEVAEMNPDLVFSYVSTSALPDDIEIAGSWINEPMFEGLVIVDNDSFTYPEFQVVGQIVSYSNEDNMAILFWETHQDPSFEGKYTKMIWTEPTTDGFVASATYNFDDAAAAEAAAEYPFVMLHVPVE